MRKRHLSVYIKSYRWQSIFIKYFVIFLLTIAIPFTALTINIFSSFIRTYHKDIQSSLNASISSYANSLESTLNNIDTNINLLSSNDHVLTYIVSADKGTSNLYIYNLGQNVSELFRHSLLSNEYIHSIQLYNKANNSITSFGENNEIAYNVFDEYRKANTPNCTLGHTIVNSSNSQIKMITIYREIYLSSKPIAVLAVNINAEKMVKNLIKQAPNSIDNLLLFSESGYPLYKLREDNNSMVSKEDFDRISESPILLKNNSQNNCLAIALHDMPYVLSVSYSNTNPLAHIWIIELISIFIMLVISFILAYKLSTYFYNSLAGILTIIENSPNTNHEHQTKDEINFLSSSILNLIQKNEHIEQELEEKTLSFKRSQMQALQMQINPHFIFNTLQFASTMSISILKKDTPVSRILSMLAELIHAVYQIDSYLIPLRQELQYAKTYLEIQSMRYDNSFSVEWEIDEDTLDFCVIKFTLQPILENAIMHGLLPINCTGKIKISARQKNDLLIIKISDTGVGMSFEKLSALRNSLKLEELVSGTGIGLRNTQQRIQNVFGVDYGLTVDADENGTTVTIQFPVVDQ